MEEFDDRMVDLTSGRRLIAFAVPTIVLMLFTSAYTMVDGLFVSNYIGTDALAAVNLLMPLMSVFMAIGFLFASGGSALVNRKVGEGRVEEARRDFSLIVLVTFLVSLVFIVLGVFLTDQIVALLGSDDRIHYYAVTYGRIMLILSPLFVLQLLFNQFLILAGRPGLSLVGTVAGGLGNLALDYVFLDPLGMGIEGAAWASAVGSAAPCAIGVAYFLFSSRSPIRFTTPSRSFSVIGETASNGVSEMVSEGSSALTMLLFNVTIMGLVGADGVAALSVINYIQFIAMSLVIGYSMGVAPVMSYNYGADRRDVMQMVFGTSLRFVTVVSLAVFVFSEVFTGSLVWAFASGSDGVTELAVHGMRLYAFAFIVMSVNVYASSFFTSLSNGRYSAEISFARGLLLIVPLMLLFSLILGIDGVWLSVPVTELLTFGLSVFLLVRASGRYGYRVPLLQ